MMDLGPKAALTEHRVLEDVLTGEERRHHRVCAARFAHTSARVCDSIQG